MDMKQSAQNSYAEVMKTTFERLPVGMQDVLLLGAIPHVLDTSLAKILFPKESEASLKTILSFSFTSGLTSGQIEYHELARRFLLDLWLVRDPDRFRQMSNMLAQEFRQRLETVSTDSTIHASEWLYHNLAFDPLNGMHLVANLFEELVESRELGSAERLLRLVEEQAPWIGAQSVWLDYFNESMAFSYYKDVNTAILNRHITEQGGSLLAACCLRLLGKLSVRQQHWANGRASLLEALKVCEKVGDSYCHALVHMDLGDLFQNLVESSGGILIETREFSSTFHNLLYTFSRGPLLLYRLLAERVNGLPNFYSMNYQNWVALHMLRLALRNYRSAEKHFKQLKNRRGQIEINSRMAGLLFVLSHTASAERLSQSTLKESLVQTSPYYSARFKSVLGQTAGQHKHYSEADKILSESLDIFERYGDWDTVAKVALTLGDFHEKAGKPELALKAYQRCLGAAHNSGNGLQQSEVAHRLDKMIQRESPDSALRKQATKSRQMIETMVFIDRYPGPVQKTFQNLTRYLTVPSILSLLIFTILIAFGAFMSVSFIAGEARIPYSDPSVWWLQLIFLFAWILLPMLVTWGYYLTYSVIGQLAILGLKFTKVDESQPSLFILDKQGISQQSQPEGSEKRISWDDVRTAVINDRALFSKPMTFSSNILVQGTQISLSLPASTFRYSEMEAELTQRLASRNPSASIIRSALRILNPATLITSLSLGVVIATVLVMGLGIHSCYGVTPPPGSECPEANRLYYVPIIPTAAFFTSVIFGIISLIRWLVANRRIRKVTDKFSSI